MYVIYRNYCTLFILRMDGMAMKRFCVCSACGLICICVCVLYMVWAYTTIRFVECIEK